MQTRGERHVSNDRMQALLELLSDVPTDEVIDKEMRCKRKVIDFIVTLIHDKGRRCTKVVMSVDYHKRGPYIMEHTSTGKVVINCKWMKNKKP